MRIVRSEPRVSTNAQILTQKWYKPLINTYDVVCIWFYCEWCQGTGDEPYGKEYDKAANVIANLYPRERHQKGKAIMVKVNSNDEKVLNEMFNVWYYPSYRIIKNGEMLETNYNNRRLSENFLQFIEEHIDDKRERKVEFDRTPIRFSTCTQELRANTYSSFVRQHNFVLIFFYAGWYQSCKDTAPVFEEAYRQLGKLYLTGYDAYDYWLKKYSRKPKVIFARMEAGYDGDVIKKFGIRKYPTFKLVRNNVVKAEYNADFTVNGFINFIKLHMEKHEKEFSKKPKLDNAVDND